VRKLLELEPGLWFSVSATTRPRRAGETDGKDYLFLDRREFERIRDEGGFLEWFDVYGDLKGTLAEFVHRLFGPETKTRFRPSYFPFTEPSAEVDYSCFNCGGNGCRICKHSGWIELGGSGMVHPNVLRAANVDPEEFTGFAFGLGIDRTCARIYQLDDIRLLFENDVRFLEQFR
jgi:phenylalanyl-tRNA synthetase alpha chain